MTAEHTEEDAAREARQDEVLAESEDLKVRLLAHTDRLEEFVATLRSRTIAEPGSNGRVD